MITCFSMTSNRPRDLDVSFGIDCFALLSFLFDDTLSTLAPFRGWPTFRIECGSDGQILISASGYFDLTFDIFFSSAVFTSFEF